MTRYTLIHSHTVDGDRTSEFYDNEARMTVQPTIDGDQWRILGVGTELKDGSHIFLHLASKTRFREQRNGRCPIQMAAWIKMDDLSAHQRIDI